MAPARVGCGTKWRNELEEIRDMFEDAKEREGVEALSGRRFIRWRFIRELGTDLTPRMMAKIREDVNTAFYAKHVFAYHGCVTSKMALSLCTIHEKARRGSKEEMKQRSGWKSRKVGVWNWDTKWVFEAFFNVDLKVVLDRQPLYWAQGLCQIGWKTLRMGGHWCRWIITQTTCVASAVLWCTEERDQIDARRKQESSQRVSWNSAIHLSTWKKHR